MLLEPECLGCLINQVYKALILLKPSISKEEIIETQKKLMEYLINKDLLKKAGPHIGKYTYQLIAEALGKKDPYKSLKEQYNRLALMHYIKIKELIDVAEDPLFEAIAISAIGNTIDFGSHHKMDLLNDIKNFTPKNLIINDITDLRKSLEKTNKEEGQVLMLLDNAGEIVFDKLLVETLQKLYPRLEIVCTVRSEPIINDATMEDAIFIRLTNITKVIEAPSTPGIYLPYATEEFKNYFYKKGIIISKGQGNFESLFGMEIPNKEVFYLLKAKCVLMERIFKVKIGDLILMKKTSSY